MEYKSFFTVFKNIIKKIKNFQTHPKPDQCKLINIPQIALNLPVDKKEFKSVMTLRLNTSQLASLSNLKRKSRNGKLLPFLTSSYPSIVLSKVVESLSPSIPHCRSILGFTLVRNHTSVLIQAATKLLLR